MQSADLKFPPSAPTSQRTRCCPGAQLMSPIMVFAETFPNVSTNLSFSFATSRISSATVKQTSTFQYGQSCRAVTLRMYPSAGITVAACNSNPHREHLISSVRPGRLLVGATAGLAIVPECPPYDGTVWLASSIAPQRSHFFSTVRPAAVHVGSSAGIVILGACPSAASVRLVSNVTPHRVHFTSAVRPAVVHVGSTADTVVLRTCPNAASTRLVSNVLPHREHFTSSVRPAAVHVGSIAEIVVLRTCSLS